MRTFRSVLSVLVIVISCMVSVIMLGSLSTANADDNNLRAAYPNSYKPGINKPCPRGSAQMFIAVLTVPRGETINSYGEMYLELVGDRFLVDDNGLQVSSRKVEFYFFPPKRSSKILLSDLRDSLTMVDYTGYYYSLRLRKQCNESFG